MWGTTEDSVLAYFRPKVVRNLLHLIVVGALKERSLSGFDVIAHVHLKFGTLLSPGTVYPILAYMETKGWIEGFVEERKKVYRLTPLGLLVSSALALEYLNLKSKMEFLWGQQSGPSELGAKGRLVEKPKRQT